MQPQSAPADIPSLAERYRSIRTFSSDLAGPLAPEDQVVQSMPDVSPTKWHLAHTSWFLETFVLREALPGYETYHPQFEYLFNSYYQGVGVPYPRPERGLITRPTVDEVRAYRAHVDAEVERLLTRQPERVTPRIAETIELGLHHEQQHQELVLTDIKHVLSVNPMRPAYRDGALAAPPTPPALGWSAWPEGIYEIGHAGGGFHFDNERPRHRTFLPPFAVATRPVTCGEYLAFIGDGGYERADLWLSDGWDRVVREGWRAPLYWEERDGRWLQFTLSGVREVHVNEPVAHVSFFEADAYATWTGYRLPLEAEWEIAAAKLDPSEAGWNLATSGRFHPDGPHTSGTDGAPVQIFGDVWEWTRSPYEPYPGFRALAGTLGEYNGKFMCNQFVLRGGSCATPAGHVRATYRNFFPPDARWQFSGIRLARDVD